jgi:ClpP class serine protease
VGISTETYTRGGRADLYSMYRPWRPDETAVVNDRITTHYQQFLKTVATAARSAASTRSAPTTSAAAGSTPAPRR